MTLLPDFQKQIDFQWATQQGTPGPWTIMVGSEEPVYMEDGVRFTGKVALMIQTVLIPCKGEYDFINSVKSNFKPFTEIKKGVYVLIGVPEMADTSNIILGKADHIIETSSCSFDHWADIVIKYKEPKEEIFSYDESDIVPSQFY